MEKKPLFFRDEGDMGDVLSQAKGISKKVQLINKDLDAKIKETDDLKEQVEEESYGQAIRESHGKKTDSAKGGISSIISRWKDRRNRAEKEKQELKAQQDQIKAQLEELERKKNEVSAQQKENLSQEVQNISNLEQMVTEKMNRLENTRQAIDNILNENKETIREKLLSNEEVEFIKLKYFSLIRSRLASRGVISPVTRNSYNEKDWKITLMENEIVAKTRTGMIKSHDDVYFDIIYSAPMDIEGYVYKKKGMEVTEQVKKFINSKDNMGSYNVLALACPTGWSDEIKSHIETINDSNTSIYLLDLAEKKMYFNRNDEKTMNTAEWFAPLTLDDEVNEVVEKLQNDIKGGEIQFRADKVMEKYKVPRKIVISAFHKIAESKSAEIIDKSEGAKDIILLTR
ncbi:MAG: hypothetical protein Q8M95_02150 [Candidatus Methanoperedens sp.]|nr:hypothetical protein [Candidatus Methanoperedens sp.]